MLELVLAALGGALLATCVCMCAIVVLIFKAHDRVQVFLQAQAIDERNERFHEVRSLLTRLHSTPSLSLDTASPEPVPIEDPAPYISDFEMDDERWQAFAETLHPGANSSGPVPVVEDAEEQ